mmetsp:Transcript_104543/g.305222  ORF Transcript_104543/g.305222 Transcript_104543/m.305222 type:complete len:106 (-) Transcript_104543:2452-2769(-)
MPTGYDCDSAAGACLGNADHRSSAGQACPTLQRGGDLSDNWGSALLTRRFLGWRSALLVQHFLKSRPGRTPACFCGGSLCHACGLRLLLADPSPSLLRPCWAFRC